MRTRTKGTLYKVYKVDSLGFHPICYIICFLDVVFDVESESGVRIEVSLLVFEIQTKVCYCATYMCVYVHHTDTSQSP